MSKKTEDKIEGFFRKATSRPEVDFRESDWLAMEKLLDADATIASGPPVKKYVIQGITVAAILFILSLGMYMLVATEASEMSEKQKIAADVNNGNSFMPDSNAAEQQHDVLNEDANKLKHEVVVRQEEILKENGVTEKKPRTAISSNDQVNKLSESEDLDAISNSSFHQKEKQNGDPTHVNSIQEVNQDERYTANFSKNESATKAVSPTSSSENNSEKEIVNNSEVVTVGDITKETRHSAIGILKNDVNEKAISKNTATAQDSTASILKKDSIHDNAQQEVVASDLKGDSIYNSIPAPKTRLNLSLLISPDFSTTGFGDYTTPGAAYGIRIAYYITPKFVINSGVIKTAKKYIGSGSDYTPPEGYWQYRTNGVTPDRITGECSVVEIPLAMQYNVNVSGRNTMFISAGLSSYIMLSESYQYKFKNDNPGAATSWDTKESSRYYFNIAHVSLGYQRQISPAIFVGVEPYLKLPFSGVGWSKVNLMTTGVYLSVGYRVLKK
jgi:hypothetical protein